MAQHVVIGHDGSTRGDDELDLGFILAEALEAGDPVNAKGRR